MDRVPARRPVIEIDTGSDTTSPPFQTTPRQLEITARITSGPAALDGGIDQSEQSRFGGRVDSSWDSATQPQPAFPSARVNRTAISAKAVRSRLGSTRQRTMFSEYL